MISKVCTKCGEELPATEEYFYKREGGKYGLRADCKACRSKYKKDDYRASKDKYIRWNKEYYWNNVEKCKQYRKDNAEILALKDREYRQKHADYFKDYRKKYRQENAEEIKAYMKEYRKQNAERLSEWRKNYHQENIEKAQRYRKENIEHYRQLTQKRRARKRALPSTFTKEQWRKCKEHFGGVCAYCGKKCKRLHQEHFVPLSKNGPYTQGNIISACGACNSSKGNKDFNKWYPKQKFYSKAREQNIIQYLQREGRDYDNVGN